MRFIKILATSTLFAASASAAALAVSSQTNTKTATPLKTLNRRSSKNYFDVFGTPVPEFLITCADPKFLGECYSWSVAESDCNNFPDYFQNRISSLDTRIGPKGGVQTCTLYTDLSCGGSSQGFTNVRVDDLRPFGMDDVARSYMCEQEWFEPPSGER